MDRLIALMMGALVGVLSTASAQSNSLFNQAQENALIETTDIDKILEITARAGAVGEVVEIEGQRFARYAFDNAGGAFWIVPRECRGIVVHTECELVETFVVTSGGLSLDQINNFHLNSAQVSTAALRSDGLVVVLRKVFLMGGVTEANLLAMVGGMLNDASRVINLPRSQTVSLQSSEVNGEPFPVLVTGAPYIERLVASEASVATGPLPLSAIPEAFRGYTRR